MRKKIFGGTKMAKTTTKPKKEITMTRKEKIDHFMSVVIAVHIAEEKLRPEWKERLSEMSNLTDKEQNERAMSYIRAVATEVVSGTSDEELENM